jgi:predicted phosphodiesterase
MDESKLDKLLQIGTDGGSADVIRGKKHKHPQGWEPLVISERGGYITTAPQETPPKDWNAFLAELLPEGMNPEDYEVDGDSVEMRAWDGNVGDGILKRFYYFKAKIRTKSLFDKGSAELNQLIKAAKQAKLKIERDGESARTYFLQITDLQSGQADGDGPSGMVSRALDLAEIAKADLAALKKAGTPAGDIFIAITGDLVEGIIGWYELQTFSVKLDRREQVKLVRRLVTEILLALGKLGLPIHVAVVPGNHGENRHNGKAFTTLSDNDDLAAVEMIAEAFVLAGIQGIRFSFPQLDRLSLTTEVQGWVVGLTHGHLARGAGNPEAKILTWFKSAAAAREPIGDADILFTGHYHSGKWSQLVGDTEWIQGGALCDASAWFSQSYGLVGDPLVMKGTITRSQKLEMLLPYRWERTRTATRQLGE